MQSWSDKKPSEVLTRTYALPQDMRDAGITISSIVSVTATVYELSDVVDNSPEDILNGAPQLNASTISRGADVIGVGQAALQSLQDGEIGCTYVVTFLLTLSTGETFAEDCLQYISEYVPADC